MEFLRRVTGKGVREQTVLEDAFLCRDADDALSLTLRSDDLQTDGAIDAYREAFSLKSGALPGIVVVTEEQFGKAGLTPAPEADPSDPRYGHLH
jgi:hypothetical protein